ncbi:hypothetical protein OVS_00470 [Mycoplasma ovis str. Michigan]|uniref:Uncharacterized protein n=1 Tax=Mycoplasma ovis str. Michigan TaxID=1415773 RepID=A0ABM5P197_9MOLU|nr:hypothetical protein [Mycoplasma ovis]AHC40095.1 hypothetical protein OVS_00470 [Mycoplasma ovis str. Michigan]
MGILTEAETLSKLPDAFTTFQKLAKFLSKEESQKNGDKDMINWLYIRSIVNPRRTIGVFSKHQKSGQGTTEGEEGLKCNGAKKKGKKENNLPLGTCFICKSGNKLIPEMIDFLKKGEIPKDKKKKEK